MIKLKKSDPRQWLPLQSKLSLGNKTKGLLPVLTLLVREPAKQIQQNKNLFL
jgi:hypothetical protein